MINRTWHWEVQIVGDDSLVAHVREHLARSAMGFRHDAESNTYWLTWDEADSYDDAREVLEVVRREFLTLTGVLKLTKGAATVLKPGGILKVHDDGRREYILIVVKPLRLFGRLSEDNGSALRKLAESNPTVAKSLRLFAAEDYESWVGLYRLYEVVLADIGGTGELVARGLASEAEHRRFKHSANSVSVGGDDSRHGVEPGQSPANPMSLAEAQSFVDGVFRAWISAMAANAA